MAFLLATKLGLTLRVPPPRQIGRFVSVGLGLSMPKPAEATAVPLLAPDPAARSESPIQGFVGSGPASKCSRHGARPPNPCQMYVTPISR